MMHELMGPPDRGPWVTARGSGCSLSIRLDDELDQEILRLFLAMAERRRYGLADVRHPRLSRVRTESSAAGGRL